MTRRALTFFLSALFILFLVYFGFRFRGFIVGPQITIREPEDGAALMSSVAVVRGAGRDVTRLELNGRPIYVNERDEFEETLLLAPGLNIIELTAEGRFGRTVRERRTVMVRDSP